MAVIGDRVGWIRTLIGDDDEDNELLTTITIQTVVDCQSVNTYAAAACAELIAAKFARDVQRTIGSLSAACQQKYEHYKDLAKCLREGGAGDLPGGDGTGVPTVRMTVGGVSIDANEALLDDADLVQPNFRIGQDDNRRTTDRDDETQFRRR